MIQVSIRENSKEYALITIEKLETFPDGTADYSVKFVAHRGTAIGIHQRVLHYFPHRKYNVLAMLKQALETLSESELEMEEEYTTMTTQAESFFEKLMELVNDVSKKTDPDSSSKSSD